MCGSVCKVPNVSCQIEDTCFCWTVIEDGFARFPRSTTVPEPVQMKMGSPAVKSHKRASKSSSTSRISMTTSTIEESFVESKLLSWMRLFRFVSLLCRQE